MCTLVEAHDPTKPLLRSDSVAHRAVILWLTAQKELDFHQLVCPKMLLWIKLELACRKLLHIVKTPRPYVPGKLALPAQ